MPILLVNHTATIEININANLQHIIGKGSFDVTIHTENDIADVSVDFVWILFKRRDGQINNNFRLDWREVTPNVANAEELRDLILGWNIPPVIVTSSVLPTGAATAANQTDGSQKTKILTASSVAITSVGSSVSSVTLLAANASRRMAIIVNNSLEDLYLKFGATASTSSFTVKMKRGDYFEMPSPCYTGIIDGIWDAVDGNAMITEIT